MTLALADRPGRELPKFWRDIATGLLAHGWRYDAGRNRGGHPQVYPPNGDRPIGLPTTVTEGHAGHRASYLTLLRRAGAPIEDGRVVPPVSVTPSVETPAMTITAVESSIQPISTVGAWWHPAPEVEPEPEPQAEPAKVIPLRREVDDPDARGTIWSLVQAQEMIRQGYHIRKVIAKTGWGANHLRDMIDDTGYYRPERI